MKGSGDDTITPFTWAGVAEETHEKPSQGRALQTEIRTGVSRIRSRSGNHYATTFGARKLCTFLRKMSDE
jgi:hypothetical protein